MVDIQTLMPSGSPEIKLRMLDPQAIRFDAPTYQFRSHGDANGVTSECRYADTDWNPQTHGKNPLLVHERLDGTLYVADGHHRLEFARRLAAHGKAPKQLAAYVMREADGYSARDARLIAAYLNLANGHSTEVEAARVLKEARLPGIHQEWLPTLPMDTSNLRLACRMSGLSGNALEAVEQAAIPAQIAAGVAARFDSQPVQDGLIQLIALDRAAIEQGFAARVLAGRQQGAAARQI